MLNVRCWKSERSNICHMYSRRILEVKPTRLVCISEGTPNVRSNLKSLDKQYTEHSTKLIERSMFGKNV
jgi:hypothetical protein